MSILRAGAARRAIAVFLDRTSRRICQAPGSPNCSSELRACQSDAENLEWVLVSAGSILRVHPVRTGVGTGRRGRAETFAEIHLDLLADSDAAYLWLIFRQMPCASEAISRSCWHSRAMRLTSAIDYVNGFTTKSSRISLSACFAPAASNILQAETSPKPMRWRSSISSAYYSWHTRIRSCFHTNVTSSTVTALRSNGKAPSLIAPSGQHSIWQGIESLGRDRPTVSSRRQRGTAWGVPAYDGGLFSRNASVSPVGARLAEIQMPDAILGPVLANLLVEGTPEDWGQWTFGSLGVREFGTIYEGLLENELAVAEADLTTKTEKRIYAPAGPKDDVVVHKGRAYLHNTSGAGNPRVHSSPNTSPSSTC